MSSQGLKLELVLTEIYKNKHTHTHRASFGFTACNPQRLISKLCPPLLHPITIATPRGVMCVRERAKDCLQTKSCACVRSAFFPPVHKGNLNFCRSPEPLAPIQTSSIKHEQLQRADKMDASEKTQL